MTSAHQIHPASLSTATFLASLSGLKKEVAGSQRSGLAALGSGGL